MEKHSLTVEGHQTGVSLEPDFWTALHGIAQRKGTSVPPLVAEVRRREARNLPSALRVLVLNETTGEAA
jgi:predicted DNA-binding ribbon-helix-helix protein